MIEVITPSLAYNMSLEGKAAEIPALSVRSQRGQKERIGSGMAFS